MTRPRRNCLWCANCEQAGADLFRCPQLGIELTRARASALRSCEHWIEACFRADGEGGPSDSLLRERELALYERRMRGDWS